MCYLGFCSLLQTFLRCHQRKKKLLQHSCSLDPQTLRNVYCCRKPSDLCKKYILFFRSLEEKVKKNTNKTESSYFIAYLLAKTMKPPHTIAKQLIKPCLIATTELILGKAASDKIQPVPVSNNAIQSRIKDMSQDILLRVKSDLQHTACFSLQVDESTDVAQCSQLVYARYIGKDCIM